MSKFKGFHATNRNGTPCWVMNSAKLDDGTPAYKIRLGTVGLYGGWSGGPGKWDVVYDGAVGLIAKNKITRGKATRKKKGA